MRFHWLATDWSLIDQDFRNSVPIQMILKPEFAYFYISDRKHRGTLNYYDDLPIPNGRNYFCPTPAINIHYFHPFHYIHLLVKLLMRTIGAGKINTSLGSIVRTWKVKSAWSIYRVENANDPMTRWSYNFLKFFIYSPRRLDCYSLSLGLIRREAQKLRIVATSLDTSNPTNLIINWSATVLRTKVPSLKDQSL